MYSKFSGNKYTRKGIQSEGVTIKEYTRLKSKDDITVTVKPSGLIIDENHKFLAASPDGVVEEDESTGLLEIKNLLQNNQASFEEAARKSTFCLESNKGKLTLKRNHNYYYQCQGQLNICQIEWLDFIVRRTNPYEIHVERIYRDKKLWDDFMVPKLTAFYHNCMLPELASPRKNTLQGIREPSKPWYTPANSSCQEGNRRQKKKKHLSDDSSDSDDASPNIVPEVRATSKRQRRTKFVGRQILHQWCTDETKNTLEWYEGTVLDCIRGVDGNKNAVYEVMYKGENEAYEVDNLQDDLNNGSLKFKDL
ncbi:hypothetical protein FSP39_003938 [Pinctada imbricata]|uniref:YqaJ viral recombinase domain-containing protein n=1 Tax=Pinctada imbricata TaxID=66713 RepID=A0AA88YM91_PINIB|nr:hypothetical protein FSP39_003938 [Pinctada imbricata]